MNRRILILAIPILLLACVLQPTIAPAHLEPAPTLPVISPLFHANIQGDQEIILEITDFRTDIANWIPIAESPSQASVQLEGETIVAEFDVARNAMSAIYRLLHDLPQPADGVTIILSAVQRPIHLLIGVKESDGSIYQSFLLIAPSQGVRRVEIDFQWLTLNRDTEDENIFLDIDQTEQINLIDFSGFTGPISVGQLIIHEIAFWQGTAATPDIRCSSEIDANSNFLVGIDANHIPEGERNGVEWYVEDVRIDPIELLAQQGVDAFRLRVWVGEDGPSKLEYATELAQRAHSHGLAVLPTIFLSSEWADVNKQPAPTEWEDLDLETRADAIRDYTRQTVEHLIETGIEVPYYAIGNEIDYGIAGVFAEIEHRDIETLRGSIWPQAAILIQAGIDGLKQADPNARILLHIAQSFNPEFAREFFSNMLELGVEFELAGLSLYPTAFGPLVMDGFCQTLDVLGNDLGLQIIIPEFAYPGETPTGGMFGGWTNALPGYPLTPIGQAQWLADFLSGLQDHPYVIGAYYFSPTFHWSGELWGPFALFDSGGRARPGIGAFSTP